MTVTELIAKLQKIENPDDVEARVLSMQEDRACPVSGVAVAMMEPWFHDQGVKRPIPIAVIHS
jgi:hypothetical protein